MSNANLSIRQRAIRFAHVADGNAEFKAAATDAVETFMRNKTRSYELFYVLREVHGNDLDGFPVPGSEGGNNPDKYKDTIAGADVESSFCNDYADNTEIGAGYIREMKNVTDKTGIYADMGVGELAERTKQWTQRRNALRKNIATAIKLYHQINTVRAYPGVEVGYKKNADGSADTTSTAPIILTDVSDMPTSAINSIFLSVGEFLTLNVDKANKLGGGWKGMKKSGGRTPGQGTGKNKGAAAIEATKISGVPLATTFASKIADWMGDAEEGKDKGFSKLMAHLATVSGDERETFVYTWGRIGQSIDSFYTQIEQEYNAINVKLARQRKAEADEQRAKAA